MFFFVLLQCVHQCCFVLLKRLSKCWIEWIYLEIVPYRMDFTYFLSVKPYCLITESNVSCRKNADTTFLVLSHCHVRRHRSTYFHQKYPSHVHNLQILGKIFVNFIDFLKSLKTNWRENVRLCHVHDVCTWNFGQCDKCSTLVDKGQDTRPS